MKQKIYRFLSWIKRGLPYTLTVKAIVKSGPAQNVPQVGGDMVATLIAHALREEAILSRLAVAVGSGDREAVFKVALELFETWPSEK